ncbi:PilZ domain-containing protein [Chrysiogenes arsenatis]|uniref:PilZ domain-containing protein n=1 Tax=Chrysiogenes arsenatis TaxID=309797 RepID=UPI0004091B1F|nr:PilZ domain-containing protein [Chrysiogenes arsenatis]
MKRDIRSQKRWNLLFYLPVYDSETGELHGRVVDLTTHGIMLVHDTQIPRETILDGYIQAPPEEGSDEPWIVMVRGKAMWSRPDINPNLWVTGYQLIDPPAAVQREITRLVGVYPFHR